MKHLDVLKVKDAIETLEVNDHLDIVDYMHVWSNGKKIRRYAGQGNKKSDTPEYGFRRMVVILVEIDE